MIAIRVDGACSTSFEKEGRRRTGQQTLINEVLAQHVRRDLAEGFTGRADEGLPRIASRVQMPERVSFIRTTMTGGMSGMSCEELDDLLQFAQMHSPVCNTVCRPVPVVVERVAR